MQPPGEVALIRIGDGHRPSVLLFVIDLACQRFEFRLAEPLAVFKGQFLVNHAQVLLEQHGVQHLVSEHQDEQADNQQLKFPAALACCGGFLAHGYQSGSLCQPLIIDR